MLQSTVAEYSQVGFTTSSSIMTTSSIATTTNYPSQPTVNSGGADGPGTVANPVATTPAEQNAAGASGGSPGSFDLSVGALIAIGVIVGIVVIVAIASSVLFYLAKKRQWAIRDSIRASFRSRRLTASYKTPTSAKFNLQEDSGIDQISVPTAAKRKGMMMNVTEEKAGDVEKAAAGGMQF